MAAQKLFNKKNSAKFGGKTIEFSFLADFESDHPKLDDKVK